MQSWQFDPTKVWRKGKAKIHRDKQGIWDILYQVLSTAGLEKRNKKQLSEFGDQDE